MSIVGKKFSTTYDKNARREMRAINGKILRVNLTTGHMWLDEPDDAFYRAYIGGRGVVLYYLLSEMPAGADPLGPDNLLVFAPGVLSGTILPGSGRHGVGAKSPLTGALASSETGGWWGSELKRAGFDAVVIEGQAEQPVYLWINDGQVEIREAGHLWGKPTGEAEDMIRAELDDERIRVSQVGPAGENMVRYATIMANANRAAGRSGLGAVMGSKNLKAVAVRGTASLGMADKALVAQTIKWISQNYETEMAWAVEGGTAGVTKALHDIGSTPVKNFTEPVFENIEQVDGAHIFELMLKERDTCNVCPVRCKIVVETGDDSGSYRIDGKYGGPEYESIGALGPLCQVDDPVAVSKANELCAAYGVDTISAGVTIAFVMECVEKGLLTPDTDGDFLPHFGDAEAMVESVRRIAYREGIGDRMAEGSARMAGEIGPEAEALVVTTKKQELPMHDPRLKNAFGLGYALSATGADHMHNMDDTFVNNPGSPNTARLQAMGIDAPFPIFGLPEEKIRAFVYETAFMNFADCAVICDFYPYVYDHVVDALNAAAGWDTTPEEIVEIGSRVINMARMFLVREGFTAADDKLPDRMYEAHDSGPIEGQAMTPELLHQALQTYYHLMDWDEEGVPTPEALKRLGLKWTAE